jgi:elongation factor 1 alpha-like protein
MFRVLTTKCICIPCNQQTTNPSALSFSSFSSPRVRTREPVARKPRLVKSNDSAVVRIQTEQSVAIATFAESKFLGRFLIRYGGATVAAGIVTKLLG